MALLIVLYVFVATFLEERRARRLAVLLAVGTLGLMGLIAPLNWLFAKLGEPAIAARLHDAEAKVVVVGK